MMPSFFSASRRAVTPGVSREVLPMTISRAALLSSVMTGSVFPVAFFMYSASAEAASAVFFSAALYTMLYSEMSAPMTVSDFTGTASYGFFALMKVSSVTTGTNPAGTAPFSRAFSVPSKAMMSE